MANPNPPRENLKPFKPGQSGNPAGCSRKVKERKAIEEVFAEFLDEVVEDNKGRKRERLKAVLEGQWLAAIKGSTQAANFFVDRVHGKVKEKTEISGPDGGPLPIQLVDYASLHNKK